MHFLAFAESSIQLFPDGTIFVHVAIILLMIYVLNRTLYRPINKVLEAREKNKGGHASEADAILADVESKESRYNKELLDTRSKGYELIEKEHKKAAAARDKKIAEAKAEAHSTFETGKADIENQIGSARGEIETEAKKLSDSIAAGILKS